MRMKQKAQRKSRYALLNFHRNAFMFFSEPQVQGLNGVRKFEFQMYRDLFLALFQEAATRGAL